MLIEQNRQETGIPNKDDPFTKAAAILRVQLDQGFYHAQKEEVVKGLCDVFSTCSGEEIISCVRRILADDSLKDYYHYLETSTVEAVLAVLGEKQIAGKDKTETYRHSKTVRSEAFRLMSEHAAKELYQVDRWIRILDVDVSPRDADLILTGMQKNGAMLSDIWEVTVRYGVKIDGNYQKQYVLGQLLGNIRYHYVPHIQHMIEAFGLEFTKEESEALYRNLVKHHEFETASRLAHVLGRFPEWVDSAQEEWSINRVREAILTQDSLRLSSLLLHCGHGSRDCKLFQRAAASLGSDSSDMLVSLAAKIDKDRDFLRIWPELKEKLFEARLKVCLDETQPLAVRYSCIVRLLYLVRDDESLRPKISLQMATELREIAMRHPYGIPGRSPDRGCFSVPRFFSKVLNLESTTADWDRWVSPLIDSSPFEICWYLEEFGKISEHVKQKIFESAKNLIHNAEDTSGYKDLIAVAKRLNQHFDDELVILNLKKLRDPSKVSNAIEEHGLPATFSAEQRRDLFAAIKATIDHPSLYQFKALEKCAALLGAEFNSDIVAQVIRQIIFEPDGLELNKKLESGHLEDLRKLEEHYSVASEEILEAHIRLGAALGASALAEKIGQVDRLIEGLIRYRRPALYGGGCSVNSGLQYAAKHGKFGEVLSALISEGDLPWLHQTMWSIHKDQEIRKAFIESFTREQMFGLVVLQSALVAKRHYHDAIRLRKQFRLPEVPELTRWRAEQN